MSRTNHHNKYKDQHSKVKRSRLGAVKQKYAEFLMVDLWYEELPIVRKTNRRIQV